MHDEGDESHMRDTNLYSFGTPARDAQSRYNITSGGKSVRFMGSPDDMGRSPIDPNSTARPASARAGVYKNYPWKCPNERLIDHKNATWRTKAEMSMHGRHLGNKLVYTLGPREAYVVDKTFDSNMNFLQLSQLSHDGETVFQKKGERTHSYNLESGYNNEHAGSQSRVTNEMRSKLYEDMNEEHDIVMSSPKKYPRKGQ